MATNAIDLTTVANVEAWLNQGSAVDASIIQGLITSYSQAILTRTGRGNLNSIGTYTERYNGNGSTTLMLRNYPIQTVTLVQVGYTVIPQSPDFVQAGWVIDPSGSQAAISIIGGQPLNGGGYFPRGGNWGGYGNAPPLGQAPWCFAEGISNVAVDYTAGYASTPYDLDEAVTEWVGDVYRSRQWIGQRSQVQPGIGTTSYAVGIMPDRVKSLCDFYRARFLV